MSNEAWEKEQARILAEAAGENKEPAKPKLPPMEWIKEAVVGGRLQLTVTVEGVARLCHELNLAWCWMLGDYSQPSFDDAEDWQVQSAINGVSYRLRNPGVTPEEMHENWWKEKREAGWVFGVTKDPVQLTHPCCVPYGELAPSQRLKDSLFSAVVDAIVEAGAAPALEA